jgi:hypothetical protein
MGVIAIFGGICTILAILANIAVPIVRGCGLIGGAEPMDGFHKGPPRKRPYPSSHRAILVAVFFVAFAIVTTIVAFGYMSNTVFDSYFESSRASIRDGRDRLYTDSVAMYVEFSYLQQLQGDNANPILPIIVSAFATLVQTQADAKNTTMVRDIGRVNKIRTFLLSFIYAIMLLPALLGLLGGLFIWKDCAQYSQSIAWYMLIVAWLAFTVHLPLSVMSGDVCNEMSNYMTYGNDTNTTIYVPTSNDDGLIANCKYFLPMLY